MNISEMIQALKEAQDSAPKPFDTPAEVLRIEGDTAWVQIPGSDDETPVNLTIAAKEGDTVQVRVSGGTAFLVGNATAPPTDDTEAYVAQARAEEVQADLNEQKEYFWHDDDGAHIQGNLSGYRNDLRSDGMYIVETSTGEEAAAFSTDKVEIGKNTKEANIGFCDGLVTLKGKADAATYGTYATFKTSQEYDTTDLSTLGNYLILSAENTHTGDAPMEAKIQINANRSSNPALNITSISFDAQLIGLGSVESTSSDRVIVWPKLITYGDAGLQLGIFGETYNDWAYIFREKQASDYSDADDLPANTNIYIGSDNTAANWSNLPNALAGHLLTFGEPSTGRNVQFYINRNADSDIFIRNSRTGTWSSWRKIVTQSI